MKDEPLLSADSAFLAVSVMGRDHVAASGPDLLRRRRLEHPLALDRGHGRRWRAVGLARAAIVEFRDRKGRR
jgi:hypothetical protein